MSFSAVPQMMRSSVQSQKISNPTLLHALLYSLIRILYLYSRRTQVNVPLLEVAATIAAVEGCNNVHMGSPVVAWANEEATSSMEVFDEAAALPSLLAPVWRMPP